MTPTFLFAIYYSYGVPLVLVYVLVLRIIFLNTKQFPSVFYRLVAVFGIQDCAGYFFFQYVQRWPTSQLLDTYYFSNFYEGSRSQVVFYFLYFYTENAGVLGATILAVNRVSCILFPFSHERVWRKHLRCVFAFYFLLPVLPYWHLLLNRVLIVCDSGQGMDKQCYMSYDHSITFGLSVGVNSEIAFILLSTISAICNIVTLVFLLIRRKTLRTRRNFKQEINLTISAVVIFFMHFGYGAVSAATTMYYKAGHTVAITLIFSVITPAMYDVVLLGTLLSLLVASAKLRALLLAGLCPHLRPRVLDVTAVKVRTSVKDTYTQDLSKF